MSKIDKVTAMKELIVYNLAYFTAGSMRGTLFRSSVIFFVIILGGACYSSQTHK